MNVKSISESKLFNISEPSSNHKNCENNIVLILLKTPIKINTKCLKQISRWNIIGYYTQQFKSIVFTSHTGNSVVNNSHCSRGRVTPHNGQMPVIHTPLTKTTLLKVKVTTGHWP